jgi:hypothetical protein
MAPFAVDVKANGVESRKDYGAVNSAVTQMQFHAGTLLVVLRSRFRGDAQISRIA